MSGGYHDDLSTTAGGVPAIDKQRDHGLARRTLALVTRTHLVRICYSPPMPLDLTLFSLHERQTYQDLGSRFDPEDALAQADSTLSALAGGTRELMAHDFLLGDQATLRTARRQLDEIHHGGGEGPVDPDAVPVLAGLVITLAREADKAAQAAAKAAYAKSNNMGDLTLAHGFRMVAKPKEGSEAPLKQAGSLR